MKIYGLDFTSAPTSGKPITCAHATAKGGELIISHMERMTRLEEFEEFLGRKGPWFAGIDFPFGQPWRFIGSLNLKHNWSDYVRSTSKWPKKTFEEKIRKYKQKQPAGGKEPLRITDSLAGAQSPLKLVRAPVAKMFFEGARRLYKAGVCVLPCHPKKDNRIVVETYPALLAKRFAGSYKTDGNAKQSGQKRTARQEIIKGLLSSKLAKEFGFRVRLGRSIKALAIDDPSGDMLDALLCAVQAAWSYSKGKPNHGIPDMRHPILQSEGWIVDPALIQIYASQQNSLLPNRRGTENAKVSRLNLEVKKLRENIFRLSAIGRALSGERNLNALLEMIVDEACAITNADGGTLYILEKGVLQYKIFQNDSLKIRMGGATGTEITLAPLQLKRSHASAYVALTGKLVNIPDVYNYTAIKFGGAKKFDKQNGYRTKSMLIVPMKNLQNHIVGVLQLINARDSQKKEKVIAFSPDFVSFIESLASQATVAFSNVALMATTQRMTAMLQENEARIRAIVDYAPDGIFVTDEQGVLESFNDAAEKIFGYTSDEVVGKNIKMLVPEAYRVESDDNLKNNHGTIKANPLNAAVELTGRRKDGTVFPIDLKMSDVRFGNSRLFSGIVRDITAQREAEKKVLEANTQLALARDQALEASQAKSRLLANMSHELRTPMNAIIGYSEMLLEDAEEQGIEDLASDLQKINTAGKQLLELINDILDLSKIEAGKMEIHLEPFNISALVQEVVNLMLPLANKNQNTLEVRCSQEAGTMIADIARVRQMLLNLLSNSCKFTENGNIILNVNREERDGDEMDWVSFDVEDSGIGMTEEQIGQLFGEFSQAHSTANRKYGGTGLGLAISRRFCRMMGGDITVKSEPNAGATFTIRLPVKVMPPRKYQRRRASDTAAF